VEEWHAMVADERKRVLAGIFDSITLSAEGWTGWNPARSGGPTSWPKPVSVLPIPGAI
jgi:hypothetical protein